MNPLYNAGIAAYAGAVGLAARFCSKPGRMIQGQKKSLFNIMCNAPYDLWVHAASLGEYEQGRPVIEDFLRRRPKGKVLLTFFSPSGYEVAVRKADPRLTIAYLPFDTAANAEALVTSARPKAAIFVKYEFWGNYLESLKRHDIPVYLISAVFRREQIFFKPWGGMFRGILGSFSRIFVQDNASSELLASIGCKNVEVAGDTRFDRVAAIRRAAMPLPAVDIFCNAVPDALTLVAGSSWEADENIYFEPLKAMSGVRAIIAPHEFDEQRLAAMSARLDGALRYTEFAALAEREPEEAARRAAEARYLIIDCFGLLSSLYRYADFAYVGGGFGAGIHNVNEAAVYGIPVMFGPRFGKFLEARDLIRSGAAVSVRSRKEVAEHWQRLSTDDEYRRGMGISSDTYICSKTGATERICKTIFRP